MLRFFAGAANMPCAILAGQYMWDMATLINWLNIGAVIAIMLAIGLRARFAEVAASARLYRLVGLAVLANFGVVPLVTVGLLYAFDASPLVAAGFLVLAVCPGAPVGPPFTSMARGDDRLATGLMVILAGLSAVLAPALLGPLLAILAPDTELNVDYLTIARVLLITQLIPLGIGLAIHQWAPRLTGWLVRPVGLLANLLLLGAAALILATQYPMLGAIRFRGWIGMGILLLASLGIGWLCGGPGRPTRRALAVTTGLRNAAVALVIVNSNFPDTPAVTAVIAYAFLCIFGTLAFAVAIGKIAD